jgi:uncharacterized protein (DUF111 family)
MMLGRFERDQVAVVEANLDDFSPQALAYCADRLLESGALDVSVLPAAMKKGRSGHMLSVLCKPDNIHAITELILTETSSIGVRWHHCERLIAQRQWQDVKMAKGSVRVKIARDKSGAVVNVQPEFEDCARYAKAYGVPLKDVLQEAMSAFKDV